MNRFVSTVLGLAVSGFLLAPSALAQTRIGGVTLTPIRPPATAPATSTQDDYNRESIPKGYREVNGRVTGPSEGLRLPAGSQIMIRLVDLTAAKSLVDIKFSTTRLSTPYQMVYNPVRLNSTHKYVVRATIADKSGKVLYSSEDTALPDGVRVTLNVPVIAR